MPTTSGVRTDTENLCQAVSLATWTILRDLRITCLDSLFPL
jgi:hypothetical protein